MLENEIQYRCSACATYWPFLNLKYETDHIWRRVCLCVCLKGLKDLSRTPETRRDKLYSRLGPEISELQTRTRN